MDNKSKKVEELIEKIDTEFAPRIVYLKSKIEDKDIDNSPEAEEIKSVMSRLKSEIFSTLEGDGYFSQQLLNYVGEKVDEKELYIRSGAIKTRELEFQDKYTAIEKNTQRQVERLYDEPSRDGLTKCSNNINEYVEQVTQEVTKELSSKFKHVDENNLMQLEAEIKSKLYMIDSDNSYYTMEKVRKKISETYEELSYNFDSRSKEHDNEFKTIYEGKTQIIETQSKEDLDLKTQDEKDRDESRKALEAQFK